jgi:hypothetical protein
MKVGNVTLLRCVNPNMPVTMTTPMPIVGTTTLIKASIGNNTHYYPTFSILPYLEKPTSIDKFRC